MTTVDVKKMSVAERLELMERLWESLERSGEEIPSPAWHAEVLAQRRAEEETGNAKWLTLDEVRQHLNRLGRDE